MMLWSGQTRFCHGNSSDKCDKKDRKQKAELMNNKVIEAGFDIKTNAEWLCTFYNNQEKEN